ncbi:MAG TPA: PA2779 family protein [Thermodesulfovibrio thiophilus]|uniref:PA2779 family protein n=1 Tax=Thermodesulfovibrio thiophilus TaxID=340095 RepID=UPI0003F53E52|nr:PA2779 family protein [Thermodesulfovibrio thiophilus]HHW21088.1 PA2779 family protein [Thermodesulfovibrio thiophilus]HOA83222.1 PA2779 family protein [Thermodesulfovibrio thiophilus]HQA04550.1 PA2779 family protein [Thermodesulfovibrio thiophilus]HQD36948.1 PA2779 family protein [Thermodesulfovibrio thiophilus]
MFKKFLVIYLAVAILTIGMVQSAGAAFIPSDLTLNTKTQDIEKIQKTLEMKVISQRLKDLGYSEKEIMDRLSTLDEQTIHELALKIDELKVAGDAGAAVILALVIIALVVLIINLTGHKVAVK